VAVPDQDGHETSDVRPCLRHRLLGSMPDFRNLLKPSSWKLNVQSSSGTSGDKYFTPQGSLSPPGWEPGDGWHVSVCRISLKEVHMYHLKRAHGKYSDAPDHEMEAAEAWCNEHSLEEPRILEAHVTERIKKEGVRAWSLEFRSDCCIYPNRWTGKIGRSTEGLITVSSTASCKDVSLMSTIPLRAGQYRPIKGNFGAYYEVTILNMGKEANISIGRS
jgi:hypothetical protein